MRDALFFSKLRVLLCGWRWKQHRRASWLKARLRRFRRFTRRLSIDPLRSSLITPHASRFVLEPLESRLLLAADLTGLVQSAALIDPAVPTNNASAVVQVQNVGNQRVNQSQVGVYASLDTTLDASDVLLGTANTGQVNAGQSKNVTVNLTIPNTLDPIAYRLLAKLDNANAIAENSETNNVAVGGTINVAWKFGNVPGRSGNTTLMLRDADGTNVTFGLIGSGLGEVIRDGSNWDLKVTGTTASSAVTILTNSGGNGRVTLNDIHAFGPLASLTAATTDLTGTLAIDGPVNIPGLLPGTITLGSIQGGTVAVPSVEALTILGSTTNAKLYIGTTLGQDGQPGGTGANADTYGAGNIGLFTVTGAMSGTSVRVGINPVDGLYGNGNDQLIGGTGSSIGGIIIGGALSADTRFYAGPFPTQYLHGLTLKPTAGDFHFISNFSGPSLSAALQQDSGGSATDQLTNNPVIVGNVTDPQGIATFVAGFGATPTVNVLSDRQPNGSFTFTQARLEQINGGLLTDGSYSLKLAATDSAGNSTQITVSFTLDTQVPVLTLDLDPASDTAPVGDQQTTNAVVTLVGQTEANALVELLGLGVQTTADASGNFSFSNVALTLGANAFTVRATDTAGNQRTETRTITRLASNQAPVLAPIVAPDVVFEGDEVRFTVSATDVDSPASALTYSAELMAGATFDPVTHEFRWTPTEAQGGQSHAATFTVTDEFGAQDVAGVEFFVFEVNNFAPVANPDSVTTPVDTPVTITGASLLANDTDADGTIDGGQQLYIVQVGPAQHGTLEITTGPSPTPALANVLDSIRYTPNPGFEGVETIQYEINELVDIPDQTFPHATVDANVVGTLTITVGDPTANHAPVLNAIGNQTIDEGQPLTFTATATDADLPVQTLTFSLANGAAGQVPPEASITPGGLFTWTPTEAQGAGAYTFDVVVTDNGAPTLSDRETITITVNEVNQAPVLTLVGNQTVSEGQPLTFTATATDTDVPVQQLTFSLANGATGQVPGGASITAAGLFTWTPTEAQGPGTYTFDVVVSDGTLSDSETITVTVNDVNLAPVLNLIGNQIVNEGQPLTFTATATDADIPAQGLTFSLEGTVPTGATIDLTSGVFTWTPTEAQGPGTYTFDVVVSDGLLSDSETITVTVNEGNQTPTFTSSPTVSVQENQTQVMTVTASDADVPVQPLTYSLAAGADVAAFAITSGGALSFQAAPNYEAPTDANLDNVYEVTVQVSDGVGGIATQALEVTVTNVVENIPAISINDVTQAEGTSLAGFTAFNFTVTLSSPTTEIVTVEVATADVTATAGSGDYQAVPPTTLTFLPGETTKTVTVQVRQDDLVEGAEQFVVNLNAATNATIVDSLRTGLGLIINDDVRTLAINDVTQAEGTSLAGFTAYTFTVTLSAPTIQSDVTVEVATADVTATAGSGDYQAVPPTTLTFLPGETTKTVTVQVRQDDLQEGTEQFVVQLSNATNATIVDSLRTGLGLIINDDVRTLAINDVTQAEGTSLAGFTAYTFTVTLSAPTIQSDVTVEVATADVTATAGSGDYQAVPLTTLTFAPGETTKTVTVQVRQDDLQEGTEQFVVQLSNATNATIAVGLHGGAGLGTITNDDINTLSIDDATVTEGDSGTSTANFTVTLSQQPTSNVTVQVATANGTAAAGSDYLAISPAQTLTFTPTGPLSQTVSVTVNGDMQLEADETFTVNLSNAVGAAIGTATGTGTILNDDFAPVLDAIGAQTVNEGEPLTFSATATDANAGQTLTFSLANGATGQVPVSASIDPTTGVFTWTPTEAQGPGTYTFDVVVSDGTLIDSETITVTVNEVNQVPTLAPISNQTATVDQALTFTAVGTDTDLPSNALAYSLEGLFSAGATIDPATGVFTWTPTAAQVGGPHGFTVRVTDNGTPNLFAEQIVQVTVEPRPNQAPVLNPIGNQTIDEGQQLSFVANATDPDGLTTFTFSLDNGLSGQVPDGAVIAGSTGQFTWTPSEAQGPGTYTFDVVVTDNGTPALSDRETITVTVNEVNQAPTLQAIPNQTVTEGQLLTFTAVGTDPDIPANGLIYSLQGVVPAGAAIDPTTGVFSWTPTNAQVGPQSVTVRVTDNDATFLFAQQIVSITVNAQPNQAPVLAPIGNQTVNEGQLVTFTATAMDTDVPVQALTFSLDGTVPPGAALDPTTGVFTWTPTEAQGPGTFTFDVMVSDGLLADSETITVTVNEVNQAPTLNPIGNQTVNEGQQLTINVNATDPDGPGLTTLIFSLENGAGGQVPDGAVIASSTGQFTWTPSEAQGPGTYIFDVMVSDGLLADSETITVTVNEVNLAPSLQTIPNQTVTAGQLLTFTVVGTDLDIPANSLTYNLDLSLLPPGFGALNTPTIDPITGVFNWTPAEGQVGTHQITVRVTDNGTGALFAEQPFQVTVVASNQAPVLNPIGSQTVTEGQLLTFNATATDADVPAQQLTFSLQGTPPTGASLTPAGVFTWTPTAGQVGAHSVTVRVTDNGAPTLFDEETITITVAADLAVSFQGLGDLPGGTTASFARGVSSDGNVVVGGGNYNNGFAGEEAFRWTRAEGIVGLGIPPGGLKSSAAGVSADGSVVVGGSVSTFTGEAFRWTASGGMVGLGDLAGGSFFSYATAVSADGSVVVGTGDPGTGNFDSQAFRWTSETGIVALGSLSIDAGLGSEAFDVSTDGTVVVGRSPRGFGIGYEAFIWTSGAGMVGLGGLPGVVVNSEAYAVSADGTVVIGSAHSSTSSISIGEAFRWTASGGMVGLGMLPGDNYSGALVINGYGSLIFGVSGFIGGSTGTGQPFIWDAVNGMRSLTSLLAADVGLGTSLAGWTLTTVEGVSTDGRVIVGNGTNPTGQSEAWRAVLPAVLPVNNAPVLNPIGNQSVNEGSTLTFTASATDSSPYQSMTYSLQGTVPDGAFIDANSGAFTWTPTETQGPGTYSFDVVVRDNSATPLEDRETISVTVNEVDENPVLNAIGNQSVNESNLLSFTATATAFNQSQVLVFSLQGTVPAGASINSSSGLFTWTPTEAQGPGTSQVTVRVSDANAPARFDEEMISIAVGELNQAPVLTPIADQTVTEGQIVTFFASATDADVPLNQLTFSLEGTVPAGASIDPQTGQFAWITAAGQAGGYVLTVRVTDNGTPALFSEQTVNVTVLSNAASFQGLGDLPGGIFSSRPFGVSGNGAVVVGESDGASGPESFRWTVGGGIENVSTLVGVPVIAVRAASFDGSVIVGVSSTGSFRWSVAEGLQTIVGNVGAHAVSSDGSVVVGKGQINIFTPGGAFRWTSATGAMHLDALSGYSDGEAFAVSADGNVIVGASYFGPSGEQEQAARWVADGFGGFTVEALGDLPGGNFMSRALAVSADGTVIVGVSESDLGPEAFRWTATEGMQRLGDGTFGGPIGVSADGSVIVGGNQGNAFVWDANNGVRNLQGVLFDLGVPGMDGWSSLSAEGISADGRTIVGQGTNPQGDIEAYRAVFPENLYEPMYSGPTSFSGQADSLINFRLNLSAPDVSDQDSATQQFQVRLIGNVPAGVTLDPFGFFSWTPTTSDIGVHQLTVRLYDNGVPSRFSEFQLEVTVTA